MVDDKHVKLLFQSISAYELDEKYTDSTLPALFFWPTYSFRMYRYKNIDLAFNKPGIASSFLSLS